MKNYIKGHRVILIGIILTSLVAMIASYGAWEWYGKDICSLIPERDWEVNPEHIDCVNMYLYTLHSPFYDTLIFPSIALVSFILLFLPKYIFNVWRWFAPIFIVYAFYDIFQTPIYTSGFEFSKSNMSDIYGKAFILISGLIILGTFLFHFWKVKKKMVS